MPTSARAVSHSGNDLYREIILPTTQTTFKVTYWDVWMLALLVGDFGDWDSFADHFRSKIKGANFDRDAAEGFLNHLRLLRQTLAENDLNLEDVLGKDAARLLKAERRTARRKTLDKSPQDREKSPWMIHTPRVEREARALRGYWDRFPISPVHYAEALTRLYKTSGYYSEDQSFGLEQKLDDYVNRQVAHAALPELFALHRAFLTVVLEKMDMVDDSYGVIGQLSSSLFEEYVKIDRSALAMAPADFFQDLIEWLIWEDYGLTYQEQPEFFAGVETDEVPLVEQVLRTQWDELRELELDYSAEKALTMLGMLCTQQQLFDRFLDLATVMGTRHWQRITTMSEMAEKHKHYELALAVYETCFGQGMHEKFLRDKYAELQARIKRKQ